MQLNPTAQASHAQSETLLAGLGLLLPASVGLFTSGSPSVLGPLPFLTIIPAFLLDEWHLSKAAVVVPSLFFFLWHPGLFRGNERVPHRTHVFFLTLIGLEAVWFVKGWRLGVEYQSLEYVRGVLKINIACMLVLATDFVLVWKKGPSFRSNLLLHWMLFAWLAWSAFPYLGELP